MLDESKIEQFVLLAKGARGKAVADIIVNATSEPGLFGFGELLALPHVQEISNGEQAPFFLLLELFAYGTWLDYIQAPAGTLPMLSPAQVTKLKQLTVVSLALQQMVLSYASIQSAVQIDSVRALEDFLITECFCTGILKGKLDQRAACVQVQDVVGRDVRPDKLPELRQALHTWLGTAESLLSMIEQRITEAVSETQAGQARAAAAAAKIDEMKKVIKTDLEMRSTEMMLDETSGLDFSIEDERLDRAGGPGYRDGLAPDRGQERRISTSRSKKRIQR